MNANFKEKVVKAIADCDRYIAIEGRRDSTLRPESSQKCLDHAMRHREYLLSLLDEGQRERSLARQSSPQSPADRSS